MVRRILLLLLLTPAAAALAWGSTQHGWLKLSAAARHLGPAHAQARATPARVTRGHYLFGDRIVERMVAKQAARSAEALAFHNRARGTASTITVYVGGRSRAKLLVAALYSGTTRHPQTLLTVGHIRSPRASGWDTVPVPPAHVQRGRTYWVSVMGEGGQLYLRGRHNGRCAMQRSRSAVLSRLPSTWKSGSLPKQCPVSAYVSGFRSTVNQSGRHKSVAPSNTSPPVISGTPQEGWTLTASDGSWSGSPTSYAYHWQDCTKRGCTDITGATSSSYTLAAADVSDTIDVVVTASDAGGSLAATSAQTATVTVPPPPSNTALPVISGTTTQGQTLTTSNASWANSLTS